VLLCEGSCAELTDCWRFLSSASRIRASNRAMLLFFSSSNRSLPGIHRIWKALSRIVSRGPGGEEAIVAVGATADAILLLPLVCEDNADERPCADVHPSMNCVSYPDVEAGDGRSEGRPVV
jgi:hypothetical protein